MGLSDADIKVLISKGVLKINPFSEESLTPAGYDLRSSITSILKPLTSLLISTLEKVELPNSLLGILHLRSSFAREGVIASLALVDPGFRGQLTILLFNSGKNEVKIGMRERFIQITFFKLSGEAEKGYVGRYQESKGIVKSVREVL